MHRHWTLLTWLRVDAQQSLGELNEIEFVWPLARRDLMKAYSLLGVREQGENRKQMPSRHLAVPTWVSPPPPASSSLQTQLDIDRSGRLFPPPSAFSTKESLPAGFPDGPLPPWKDFHRLKNLALNYSHKVLWIGCWPGANQRNFSIPTFIYKICNLSLLIETRWYWLSRKFRGVCLGLNRGEPVVIAATHSSIKIPNQKEKIKSESILPQACGWRTLWWFEQSLASHPRACFYITFQSEDKEGRAEGGIDGRWFQQRDKKSIPARKRG